MPEATQQTRLIPLVDWEKYHPYPTKGTLRSLAFHNTNNFNKCIRRINYRVLIDERAFFEWVDEQNGIKKEQ